MVSGREAIRALERCGFAVDHQRGSHVTLRRGTDQRLVTVPCHAGRDLKPGTLHSILRQAGLTAVEFADLLRA